MRRQGGGPGPLRTSLAGESRGVWPFPCAARGRGCGVQHKLTL